MQELVNKKPKLLSSVVINNVSLWLFCSGHPRNEQAVSAYTPILVVTSSCLIGLVAHSTERKSHACY